jgi:hypothetical protein
VRAGVAGALLDQERSDIFTQTVAAIPAKGAVSITLRFDTVARYQDGTWELVVPLVVAPRFVPGAATNRPTGGTGRAPDTDRAPDASRITPGGSPGAGGATEMTLEFTDKITDLVSPSHDLKVGPKSTLIDPRTDHDAVIRWKSPVTAAGWVEQGSDGGYAAIVVEAPAAPARRSPIRWTLVLDRSATSRGDAEAAARPLVRSLFQAMGASDRVAVTGSDQINWGLAPDVARTVDDRWSTMPGAFDLTRVLQAARPEGSPLLLISGALVADDRAAIAAAVKLGVPVHVIGVGPAPARSLLTQIAAATGGTVRFAITGDDIAALAKATLSDLASTPAPLTVTWGTLAAREVVPGALPRLGAGQAMLVLARVPKAQSANGRARGELFAIDALPTARTIAGQTTNMGPLARRWARNRLDELLAQRVSAEIIATHAMRYGLVSPYTSMVAIGDEVVVQGGVRRSISVPVSVPAGMKWQQVKKETTVDRTSVDARATKESKKDGYAKKADEKPVQTGKQGQTAAKTPVKPTAKQEPKKEPPKAAIQLDEDKLKNVPTAGAPAAPDAADTEDSPKKARRFEADDGDGAHDSDEAESLRPSPTSVALGMDVGSAEIMRASDGRTRRFRIATSLGGGFTRSGGESVSLLTGGARLELGVGRRLLAGVDTSLWIVDGEVSRGQALASFAVVGIKRWLELGFGAGVQFGEGVGPAAGLSLRFHLPPAPRASLFLRYDGAMLYETARRRGQSSLTFGVEYSF